jgi:hypothetical protein
VVVAMVVVVLVLVLVRHSVASSQCSKTSASTRSPPGRSKLTR